MAEQTRRAAAVASDNADKLAMLENLIAAKDGDGVVKLFQAQAGALLASATEADELAANVISLQQQVCKAGGKVLGGRLQKLMDDKIVLGLPPETALEAARNQIAHDDRVAAESAKK